MDDHTNILLYSKFSPASRKFIEMLDKIPNFNLLCIDNKKTRERILKSDSLNIKEVPCILRVYQDTGYVETFEGEKAFRLLKTYIDQYKKQQTPVTPLDNTQLPSHVPMQMQQAPMQQAPMQQAPMQQVPMQQAPMQQAPMQQVPMQQAPMQQVPMQQVQPQPSQMVSQLLPESQPRQDTIQKQQQLINATSIEDLGADVNKGQTMNTYMHVPKSVEFDIDIENRQRTVKQDRSVKSNDGGNIVNRAMQMQKEREQESSMQPMNRM